MLLAEMRTELPSASVLSWATAGYESAQRERVRFGEQLRSVLQGRAACGAAGAWCAPEDEAAVARLLKEIRASGGGPVPILGYLYANAWSAEREMAAEMERLVIDHPTWPWLHEVDGIGTTLAARLLGRLDIIAAPSPASFWTYCGLATVPAECFRCARCSAELYSAPGTRFTRPHRMRGGAAFCSGQLRPTGLSDTIRAAQGRPRHGERARYDLQAKTICYLIGVSFLRRGTTYREIYNERKLHLTEEHPEWTRKHAHLAAIRATVKRFLADLWVVWRGAELVAS
jgi:hypothetical protein